MARGPSPCRTGTATARQIFLEQACPCLAADAEDEEDACGDDEMAADDE